MANVPFNTFVDTLPVKTPLVGTEIVPITDGGVSKQTTASAIAALGGGGGGGGTPFNTGPLANNNTFNIAAIGASHVYKVYCLDAGGSAVVGEWTVFGMAQINAVIS